MSKLVPKNEWWFAFWDVNISKIIFFFRLLDAISLDAVNKEDEDRVDGVNGWADRRGDEDSLDECLVLFAQFKHGSITVSQAKRFSSGVWRVYYTYTVTVVLGALYWLNPCCSR